MNKTDTSNVIVLRIAAQNAAHSGHLKEAQGIYQRILKALERQYGKESTQYKDCLTEAALHLHTTWKEAAG